MTDNKCSPDTAQPSLSPEMVLQEARSLITHLNSLNKPYSAGCVVDCIATIENFLSRIPAPAQAAQEAVIANLRQQIADLQRTVVDANERSRGNAYTSPMREALESALAFID